MHWDGSEREFRSPFDFHVRTPLTLVELRMRRYSGKIRQKPRWWEKVLDEALVQKWREEMAAHDRGVVDELWGGQERYDHGDGRKKWPRDPITEAQMDFIFEELRYEAGRMEAETGIYAAAVPMVYESQYLVPDKLRDALLDGVRALEDVPEEDMDWHPGSNKQVLDLVHPSLYPLRIGHTHILNQGEKGLVGTRVITLDEYMDSPDFGRGYVPHWALSDSFQWLPTDFQVSKTGKVKALGYINNLHPVHHKETYGTVARLLERFLPLFENVVADTLGPERPHAIQVDPLHWYDGLPTEEEDDAAHEHEDADESIMDADWQWYSYEQRICWPVIPDPKPFAPPANADTHRPAFSLAGRTLQVIVKLANIVLTPDDPRYPGGAWHVEGMLNERIVATCRKLSNLALVLVICTPPMVYA